MAFHLKRATSRPIVLHYRRLPHFLPNPPQDDAACSIQILANDDSRAGIETGFRIEHPTSASSQEPIDALVVTTKAQHVRTAVERLIPRLSRASTLFLLCNGLPSVLPDLAERVFPHDDRPSFILGHTSHGVHRVDPQEDPPRCHGTWRHAGLGRIVCSVWPGSVAAVSPAPFIDVTLNPQ